MHLFGALGALAFLVGFVMVVWLIVERFIEGAGFGLTRKVGFFLAPPVMIIGVLFFLTGFLAELIVRNAADRNAYLTEERIGLDK
jgi:hypothetical protein